MDKRVQTKIFISVTIASFATTYIAAAFNIALPAIGRDLGMARMIWLFSDGCDSDPYRNM